MENPSLRVSGHVSSMNRIFIVEDYAEDDLGQWAKDEVTGEQSYVDDGRSCFWTWDDTECAWQSRPFKERQVKKKKEGKRKRQRTIQNDRNSLFSDEQEQDPEWWSEEDFAWWSKGRKGKKGLSKGNDGFQKVGFALTSPKKVQARTFTKTEEEERIKKEKGKEKNLSSIQISSLRNTQ